VHKRFLKIDKKVNQELKKDFNVELMDKKLKDIFIEFPICGRYSETKNGENHNAELIKEIYENNEETEAIEKLEQTYIQVLDCFRKNNLEKFRDDILNYRGYFIENEDEEEKKFYEYGAHFPYMFLYQRLEIIQQEREKNQKELEKKLKEKENNNKQSRDDPATNEESKPNENLKDLLNIFQQKGKSRNRGDVDIGLTYMPQMKKDKEEQLNPLEHFAAGLIKSTAGKKDEGKTKNKIIKNIKKNNVLKKDELIGANSKYNNYLSKNKKNSTKKEKKKKLRGNKKKKIEKRTKKKI
jgi:hypothetical protein